MLVPVQTSGDKPPLFFVHGIYGVMFLASAFARILGPDQPFFAVNASGIDGRSPVLDNVPDMVSAYLDEIQAVSPSGPLRIAGMCSGCFLAIEMVRELRRQGRQAGPPILADPPAVSLSAQNRTAAIDVKKPAIAQQLYEQARATLLRHLASPYNDKPFDATDPRQLHAATLAAVGSLIASASHVPMPLTGPAELIISAERAPGFFHPQMPWRRLLPGPRVVHVLPWGHQEMLRVGHEAVARLLKFMLENEFAFEPVAERSVA